MTRPRSGIASVIRGVLFIAAGAALAILYAWPLLNDAQHSRAWPSVPGTIEQSESHTDSEGNAKVKIGYRYVVDGVELHSKRVAFGDWIQGANQFRYPLGKEVSVYYNPADPSQSVLEPGAAWGAKAPLYAAGGLALLGLLSIGRALLQLLT